MSREAITQLRGEQVTGWEGMLKFFRVGYCPDLARQTTPKSRV